MLSILHKQFSSDGGFPYEQSSGFAICTYNHKLFRNVAPSWSANLWMLASMQNNIHGNILRDYENKTWELFWNKCNLLVDWKILQYNLLVDWKIMKYNLLVWKIMDKVTGERTLAIWDIVEVWKCRDYLRRPMAGRRLQAIINAEG